MRPTAGRCTICCTARAGWSSELRLRAGSTEGSAFREYEVVAKPDPDQKGDGTETTLTLEDQIPDGVRTAIVYSADAEGHEVTAIRPIP